MAVMVVVVLVIAGSNGICSSSSDHSCRFGILVVVAVVAMVASFIV